MSDFDIPQIEEKELDKALDSLDVYLKKKNAKNANNKAQNKPRPPYLHKDPIKPTSTSVYDFSRLSSSSSLGKSGVSSIVKVIKLSSRVKLLVIILFWVIILLALFFGFAFFRSPG